MIAYYYASPFGILELKAEEKITSILFVDEAKTNIGVSNAIEKCISQLDEYFLSKRKVFDTDYIEAKGTAFQNKVWDELLKIPYGKTISYIELARRMGDEKLVRAVGTPNGKNPISIIIPCHRVIGADGKLVGYSGGLLNKKALLQFEGALLNKGQMSLL